MKKSFKKRRGFFLTKSLLWRLCHTAWIGLFPSFGLMLAVDTLGGGRGWGRTALFAVACYAVYPIFILLSETARAFTAWWDWRAKLLCLVVSGLLAAALCGVVGLGSAWFTGTVLVLIMVAARHLVAACEAHLVMLFFHPRAALFNSEESGHSFY